MKQFRNRLPVYLLCLLHLILGLNGSIGGLLLLLEPDGSLLGMQSSWLADSPFNNYFIPGLLLFAFLGVLPLLTLTGLLIKFSWKWLNTYNIYRDKHWSWSFSLYTGIISITWITVQLIMTQYFWIQPVIIFTGLLIIVCTMIPVVINQYELRSNE